MSAGEQRVICEDQAELFASVEAVTYHIAIVDLLSLRRLIGPGDFKRRGYQAQLASYRSILKTTLCVAPL